MRLVLVSFSFFLPSFFSFSFLFLSFLFCFCFVLFCFLLGGGGRSYPEFSLGCSLHSVHALPATGYLAGEVGACISSRVIDIFSHYAGARLITCSRTRDLSKGTDVSKS